MVFISGLISCDETPPVTPVLPDVIGCTVAGDITLDYTSIKGFLNILTGQVYQFQLSSTAKINNESYALVISIFPKNKDATSGFFTIVKPGDTSVKENYAYALFITGWDTPREVSYWANTGTIDLSEMQIGQVNQIIKGNFNFVATSNDTVTKTVTVSDGWIDYSRKY